MEIAYLDCFSGISGDMLLGALLDAGLPFQELTEGLGTLPLEGYRVDAKREARNHLYGTRVLVTLDTQESPPRNLEAIRNIIRGSELSLWVQDQSIAIFEHLARVEGGLHGLPPEHVHFHEVGAVDSIVDIVGCVFGVERLGIQKLFASPLPLGSGFVETQHGRLPVPAPATLSLLQGVPICNAGVPNEMVTPTGAALAVGLACTFGPMPPMVVRRIGYGAGSRIIPDRPNLLRILLGEDQYQEDGDVVALLETNLDDVSPEWLGYIMERLFDAGALDVVLIPVHMKKNRPGVQVQVMADPHRADALMEILFVESGTLGIRHRYSERKVLQRALVEVESPWGTMTVKKIHRRDGSVAFHPEYEACCRAARNSGRPLREVFAWVASLNRDAS
jgi:uncharacterized protein (TIGR00299 family) protein